MSNLQWGFEIQTDNLISARRLDPVIVTLQKEKKYIAEL